ncbi:MAG: tRNA (adenosine(37)-N6)-threonylcarbamoyltransferase complex transferase subunit TsaD [Candidatus Moranbacteria bacterium RIFOXYB1_FULL_43_19]|nr:MAG: tRNA (adenosine(37)-N6)-threonylcarbamoyltransferase complex transferase subunit TsaD [Candidatus Moranbacteria bacterium RIFOXYB1_FULL_43_19]OGI33891.1 MAG: tRNA (adenosine(37)-N6)-threonylcarbamoyltransferase complex transferase subunit TsaD [Candidatus Moranbacteria bacterium RIFOXYC1_FULL_44_13]OGI38297.1 MAG: tRNA (adenosine(37)-N6)-threonylcarbamoyltransferase complex transferase subunit TsaD [Candidatus Moranbacteria bacterium RIFOXYD1_FULL_44_12]
MQILAIETSCDETAVALVKAKKGVFFAVDEYISSQTKIHSPFGGVVPNLAAREHLKNLPILLKKIIAKNKIRRKDIDLIAVTEGPGLIPALLIGTNAAKALAYAWQKPLVGANHIAGHVYANFIGAISKQIQKSKFKNQNSSIEFPILALIVSGGHTELILMKKHMNFNIIGQTLDDAAGEAFDKAAKILGLGYPGGPEVSSLAEKYKKQKTRYKIQDTKYRLPRPMLNSPNFNFSFSGLKTALLYTVRDNPKILRSKRLTGEICAEFQQAVIDVLLHKTLSAAKKFKPKTILLGGGVSANKELRKQLRKKIKNEIPDTKYQLPDTKYSLDNAAMIAVAGHFKFRSVKNKKIFRDNWKKMEADASLKLS